MKDSIGEKIRILRKAKGLTQEDLGEHIGAKRSTVGSYETGRRTPYVKDLEKIAAFFGVGLDYFGVTNTREDVQDILARSRKVFENNDIPAESKEELYKEIMRLYLTIADGKGK